MNAHSRPTKAAATTSLRWRWSTQKSNIVNLCTSIVMHYINPSSGNHRTLKSKERVPMIKNSWSQQDSFRKHSKKKRNWKVLGSWIFFLFRQIKTAEREFEIVFRSFFLFLPPLSPKTVILQVSSSAECPFDIAKAPKGVFDVYCKLMFFREREGERRRKWEIESFDI